MEGAGSRPGHALVSRACKGRLWRPTSYVRTRDVAVTRRRGRTNTRFTYAVSRSCRMQCNLGGEIHVTRRHWMLCSHTRGGAEGCCLRLDMLK